MGDPTAIQRAQLDAERQALRARVASLRRKVSADRDELRAEARNLAGPESPLAQHPKATVATAAVAGFAAARVQVPRPHLPAAPLNNVASKGAGAGVNLLKVEAGIVIRDIVDGLFERGGRDSDSAQP